MLSQFFSIQYECFVFVHVPYCDVSWIFFYSKEFFNVLCWKQLVRGWKKTRRRFLLLKKKCTLFLQDRIGDGSSSLILLSWNVPKCALPLYSVEYTVTVHECTTCTFCLKPTQAIGTFFFQQSYFSKSFASSGNFIGN